MVRVNLIDKILILGGTGSLGTLLAEGFLSYFDWLRKLYLLTNNEYEIFESRLHLHELYPHIKEKIEWILCDVRDACALRKVIARIQPDLVINCAALKHVSFCQEYPMEAVKTNIMGTANILGALQSLDEIKCWTFLQVSTDKAVEPVNVMGATKFIAEEICLNAHRHRKHYWHVISCVRFGNVFGTRGSLKEIVERKVKNADDLILTDENMMRYIIHPAHVFPMVEKILKKMKGGEIFVPSTANIKKVKIKHLIDKIARATYSEEFGMVPSEIKLKEVGRLPCEKLEEKLVAETEWDHVEHEDDFLVIRKNEVEKTEDKA